MAVALAQSMDANVAVRIELTRPVVDHNQNISHIDIMYATLSDFIDCGPIQRQIAHDPGPNMKIEIIEDHGALMKWMVRLTRRGEAVLRQLAPRDAFALKKEVERMAAEFATGNAPA